MMTTSSTADVLHPVSLVVVVSCRRYLLVVVLTLIVSCSSGVAATKTKPRAATDVDRVARVDVDRPAVDDPSAVVDIVPASFSSASVDEKIHQKHSKPNHRRLNRPIRHSSDRSPLTSFPGDEDAVDAQQAAGVQSKDAEAERADNGGRLFVGTNQDAAVGDSGHAVVDTGAFLSTVTPAAELDDDVIDLRSRLKESHATHMHTRSVINVLQEKQEAHERDMAIMKDELAQLKRDLAVERELVRALKTQTADAAWALADVKRGQDQVAGDLAALKSQQEHQNESMYLVEDLMMSNALELISHNKHAVAVRHDVAQLKAEAATDRSHIRDLNDQLQRYLAEVDELRAGQHWGEGANSIDEEEEEMASSSNGFENHLQRRPASHGAVSAAMTRSNHVDVEPSTLDAGSSMSVKTEHLKDETSSTVTLLKSRLDQYDAEIDRLNALVAEVNGRLQDLSSSSPSRQRSDDDAVAVGAELLQQAFVNFTRHMYGLEESSRYQPVENNGVEILHGTGSLHEALPTTVSVERRFAVVNESLFELRLAADSDRVRTDSSLQAVDRRLADLAVTMSRQYDQQVQFQLLTANRSLERCQRTNVELVSEVRTSELVRKVEDLERRFDEQSTTASQNENSLNVVKQELRRHTETLSSLSKQAKLLRYLPQDAATMQADLGNIAAQLPTDCASAMGNPGSRRPDGVYLIRQATQASGGSASTRPGRPSTMRVYCQRDSTDPSTVWTVIQRRSDGRESFARGWEDYRTGFGDPAGEHWLGNDHISSLTSTVTASIDDVQNILPRSGGGVRAYRLHIGMWDIRGRYWVAEYPAFRVAGRDDLYRLELGEAETSHVSSTRENALGGGAVVGAGDGPDVVGGGGGVGSTAGKVGGFTGNATDSLRYSDRQSFSAVDRDNDVSTTDCARYYSAGWWYKHCHYANLNGRYTSGIVWFNEELDEWLQMKHTVMKIAPATKSASSSDLGNHSTASFSSSSSSSPSSSSPVFHEMTSPGGSSFWVSPHHRNKSKVALRIKDSAPPPTLPSTASGTPRK